MDESKSAVSYVISQQSCQGHREQNIERKGAQSEPEGTIVAQEGEGEVDEFQLCVRIGQQCQHVYDYEDHPDQGGGPVYVLHAESR